MLCLFIVFKSQSSYWFEWFTFGWSKPTDKKEWAKCALYLFFASQWTNGYLCIVWVCVCASILWPNLMVFFFLKWSRKCTVQTAHVSCLGNENKSQPMPIVTNLKFRSGQVHHHIISHGSLIIFYWFYLER